MKSLVLQAVALIALAAVVGGAANLTYGSFGKDSGAYARHLEWLPRHYTNATVVEGCAERLAGKAPQGGAAVTPERSPAVPAPPANDSGAPGAAATGAAAKVEPPPTAPAEDAHSRYPMIEIAAFLEELTAGSLVIDARRTKAYVAGHVPGAISVPAWEHPGERVNALLEAGAVLEAPTIVYCSNSKECEDSVIVSDLLAQAGFLDLKIYKGGFPEWQETYPQAVATGEERGEFDPAALAGGAAE